MKWIMATERLPKLIRKSREIFCRNIKDGRKRVFWYSESGGSMLKREPYNWEWLDEDFETDYETGYNDAIRLSLSKISALYRTFSTSLANKKQPTP